MLTSMYQWWQRAISSSDSAGQAQITSSEFFYSGSHQLLESSRRLAPLVAWLRLLRVQLYAYLDDLLVMGESKVEVAQSIQTVIQVLIHAGFVVNLKKFELTPSQDLVYIGARFQIDLGRLYLPRLSIQALIACVVSYCRVGEYKPAHQFLRLLGLMAETLQSVEYAHLCI